MARVANHQRGLVQCSVVGVGDSGQVVLGEIEHGAAHGGVTTRAEYLNRFGHGWPRVWMSIHEATLRRMGRGVTGERVPGERDSGWNPVYSRLTGGRGVGNARETRLKTLENV